jgi:ribonuclease BN (tRNA processing enzyme)
MRLTILGSGTVVAEPTRVCASYYLEAGDARILLDCGPGAVHAMARLGLPWGELTHLAITHFHTDHTGELPYLLFALKHGLIPPRTAPIAVFGPAGTVQRLRAMADAFGSYVLHPGVRLNVHELGSGHEAEVADGVRIRACKTYHTEESLAYRIEAGGRTLAYTGDTGRDAALEEWLAGADALLCECSLPDGTDNDRHLTPSGVAALARSARPGRILLTHIYPQLERADLPALVRRAGWSGSLQLADDGLSLDV